ncbi:intermembrane transport protein PqiB [Pinirhizobacter soli]|uniref:PqiB family protein n=1 Tax=Pinirhizobacter soli TaxID=2786953 RepID=UPI00202A4DEA|nr:MlaD family protein [Pinirhizobacter soli]
MTEPEQPRDERDDLPEPVVQKRRVGISLIWLVPLVAAIVGASLLVHGWLGQGPSIIVTFQTAEGLEANKTQVKYKNVVIGKVTQIALNRDHSQVKVKIDLEKNAESFATKDTRFWVVRPRVGIGGVSGVDTLFSGAFIGADTGDSTDEQDEFKGLETPPPVLHGQPGRRFTLHSGDLGSLDIGSPVYFRRVQVGHVVSHALDENGKGVSLQVFIDGPNDRYVSKSSRFWNASGVDVSLGADGLKLNTQSLATVLAGGVAFQSPNGPHDDTPAEENTDFDLYNDQASAMAPPDGEPRYIRMRFDHSLRGLRVDSPVEFLGINVGKVVSLNLDYDIQTQRFPVIVGAVVYPERLGKAHQKLMAAAIGRGDTDWSQMVGRMVEHGLRAQARTGNLLTGQLYIAIDFDPKAKPVAFDSAAKPLELPTTSGDFDKIQEQIGSIVDKIQKIPFDTIGKNLDESLKQLSGTLKQVNESLAPEATKTFKQAQQTLGAANNALSNDSPLQQNLGQTLQELQRTARSLRVLTDYLSRHPESLIRGKGKDAAPAQASPPPAAPATSTNPPQGAKP